MPWLAVSLLILAQAPSKPASRPMEIYFIDVLGGAATLVVTPERESILLDSGWPGNDDRDPKRIERILRDEAKLDHLDHLVTTHWHVDHFGGVEGLARRVRVDHFWDRGLPDPSTADGDKARFPDGPAPDDPLGIAYRQASRGKRATLAAGDRLPLEGSTEAVVLAAGGLTIKDPRAPSNPLCDKAPADQPADTSDNARSLVLRFRLGSFDFLDCGDLTWNVEKRLVCPLDLVGPVDLFQVTHHGMDISNHPTFLETIAPTVAVMNNGPRKGGAPATVRRLGRLPSLQAAYQLHKNRSPEPGDNTNPTQIANLDGTEGNFIRVTVEPDGGRYTVQVGPGGGRNRLFLSK